MWGAFVKFTEDHPDGKGNIFMWQWQPVGVVKNRKPDETAFSKRSSVSYVLVHGRYVPLRLSPLFHPQPLAGIMSQNLTRPILRGCARRLASFATSTPKEAPSRISLAATSRLRSCMVITRRE